MNQGTGSVLSIQFHLSIIHTQTYKQTLMSVIVRVSCAFPYYNRQALKGHK